MVEHFPKILASEEKATTIMNFVKRRAEPENGLDPEFVSVCLLAGSPTTRPDRLFETKLFSARCEGYIFHCPTARPIKMM